MSEKIPVGTSNANVRVWLIEVDTEQTNIYVAIAVAAKDDKKAQEVAERIRNQEMLALRHVGYKQVGDPDKSAVVIHGVLFREMKYVFKRRNK